MDVEKLRTDLLFTEFQRGAMIANECKHNGYTVPFGFAIAYRAGILDGRKAVNSREKEIWQKLGKAEQRIKELEGMLQIFKPNAASATVDLGSVSDVGTPDPGDPQPIPGVDEEGVKEHG